MTPPAHRSPPMFISPFEWWREYIAAIVRALQLNMFAMEGSWGQLSAFGDFGGGSHIPAR